MKLNILKLLSLSALVCGCSYDFPEPDPATLPSKGDADLTTYVAVGNSITAGYMNGALYQEGQLNSYAKILSDQFKPLNDNAAFNIPTLISEKGGFGGIVTGTTTPYGRLYLKLSATCPKASPSPRPTVPGDALTAYSGDKSTLNNFGVPGVKLVEAVNVPTYGTLNPFYGRFAVADKTLIQQAAERKGTFFSMWLGSNDVLAYAIAGGTGSTNGTNPSDMTPLAVFTPSYTAALTAMLGTNAKGVVANIPDVTSLPHFTTINPNIPTFMLDANSATGLNMLYAAYGYTTVDGTPLFKAGANNFVISVGADADKKVRQFDRTKDFFLLTTPTDSLGTGKLVNACGTEYGNRAGWGVAKFSGATPSGPNPIADKWLLDDTEVASIKERVAAFNAAIKAAVDAANAGGAKVSLVDINKVLGDLSAAGTGGILVSGLSLNASILPPYGGFSLDGIHPNPRGHAYIANQFIQAINTTFKANVLQVNPNNYKGNELPTP
jgi:hypothetical protein